MSSFNPHASPTWLTKYSCSFVVLTPFHCAARREQSDADVDAAVAQREDPAVAGHDVAVGVADVEVRVDPGFVVAIAGVVAAQRHAHRPVAIAVDAEVAPEPRVRAVGDDEVAAADALDGAAVLVLHDDAGRALQRALAARGRFEQVERLDAVQHVGAAAWRRPRRRVRRG